jgi:hypothetical protein
MMGALSASGYWPLLALQQRGEAGGCGVECVEGEELRWSGEGRRRLMRGARDGLPHNPNVAIRRERVAGAGLVLCFGPQRAW